MITGDIVGTPAYMAPELVLGPMERIGPAADIYLLGAMLYEIITGNPPDNNDPASVGIPLSGIEVRIGENDELLTRSECVMLGYWNKHAATAEMIDQDG